MIAPIGQPVSSVVRAASVEDAFRIEAANLGTTMDRIHREIRCRTVTCVALRHAVIRAVMRWGFSDGEIADEVGLDRSTICHLAKEKPARRPIYGPPLPSAAPHRARTARLLRARAELAAALRELGLSWPEVAEKAGYASHAAAMGAVEAIEGKRNLSLSGRADSG